MISVDAYPFLASSDLTCYLEDMGISVFSGCTMPPDSKDTKLGSIYIRYKYWGSFSAMLHLKVCPYKYF